METTYKDTPLFGGALACDMPARFADISHLRQVPDSQECYIDKEGFTSIIVEINERVGGPGSSAEIDGAALTTHLEEIVPEGDLEGLRVWNTTSTQFSHLDEDIPAYTLIATVSSKPPLPPPAAAAAAAAAHHQGTSTSTSSAIPSSTTTASSSSSSSTSTSTSSSRANDKLIFTALIITLVRLEREATDILITINVPHISGEYDEDEVDLELGKQGKLIGDAVDYAARIWETFRVRDWGLFKEV